MQRALTIAVMCALAGGCATERTVARQLSELEARRLAVETALAERVTKVESTANLALSTSRSALKLAEGKFKYEVAAPEQIIQFDPGSSKLTLDAQTRLSAVAQNLKTANRNVFIEVQGHTDNVGDSSLNQRVAQARADNVRAFLYQQGVALNRMSAISFGENVPIAPNDTASGRLKNRRVVLQFKM